MDSEKKKKYSGLASLFDSVELKSYFINYLYFIIGVEILIFLISFLGNLGPEKGPFPWKFYFYVSFITPVAITFLLGVFILSFNQFIFGKSEARPEDAEPDGDEAPSSSKLFKFGLILHHMREIPYLPMLFLLVAGAVFFYKLDDIFRLIFSAGEKMAFYLLIAAGILLGAGLIFGLIWIVMQYRLNKKHMEHEYAYRKEVMDKLGFLIMKDDTVIDKEGNLISNKPASKPDNGKYLPEIENLKFLPPSKRLPPQQ